MTEDQQERLRVLEATVAEIRVRQSEIEGLLHQTQSTVAQIKTDTSEIVELMKSANLLARISKWAAVMIGAFVAGKGLKWW